MTVMRIVVLAIVCAGLPSTLAAQRQRIAPAPSVLFHPVGPTPLSRSQGPTYWKEGALIGGIPVGVLGFLLVDGLCRDDGGATHEHCGPKAIGGAALGFLTGAVVGSLIGGQIPKHE